MDPINLICGSLAAWAALVVWVWYAGRCFAREEEDTQDAPGNHQTRG